MEFHMPNLHGQPTKDEIRADLRNARRLLAAESKEHIQIRRSLRLARAKIAEQAAQIEKMKAILQGAVAEADRDIKPAVFKRYEESFAH